MLSVDADVEEVHLPASPSVGVTMARLSSPHPPFELLQAALLVPIHKSFQMKKKYKKADLPHLILEVDGSYKGTGQTRSKGASLESMRCKVLQI